MAHLSTRFSLEQPADRHAVKQLKRELDTLPGVTSVSVSGSRLAVDYDPSGIRREDIQQKVQSLGFGIQGAELENRETAMGRLPVSVFSWPPPGGRGGTPPPSPSWSGSRRRALSGAGRTAPRHLPGTPPGG